MLDDLTFHDPFGRDTSWITREMCEAYAVATLRGKAHAIAAAEILTGNNAEKIELLKSTLACSRDFEKLKEELIEEFGLEHFIKIKSRLEHIRDLEERMESEEENRVYALLVSRLCELRGWVEKPGAALPPSVINNVVQLNATQNNMPLDKSNVLEMERYAISLLG